MTPVVVLDAAAFDVLDTAAGAALRGLLRRTVERGGEVRCAAVTLAEVCRGPSRTRRVEAALAVRGGGRRVRVVPTDERLAKLVGAVLQAAGVGSDQLADAHVVAVCADAAAAIVVTADPDDLARLSAAIPGTRVVTRRPSVS